MKYLLMLIDKLLLLGLGVSFIIALSVIYLVVNLISLIWEFKLDNSTVTKKEYITIFLEMKTYKGLTELINQHKQTK